ncbi:hypothetical protein [Nocardioides sp. CER19]|uniref:hypothetical protein n=1 Tax=Nocardioides sp. CER19 TaxID=3038538 RepID=UPI00244999B7|nr:hypothetical protein [Nocardioides sp. CER19]MDH2412819.1 hypothetical protein [Nocardioides sp. CER19]
MKEIPSELMSGPFTRRQARAAGVTDRMLQSKRFVRVHHGVWRLASYEMTGPDLVVAARLALPDRARMTGLTRIQALGLDFGPSTPVRFVIEGDHHLALKGVFLHRTRKLAPGGAIAVSPAAAFLAFCAEARAIDALKVGDWLLHHAHMTVEEVRELALAALWRDGAHEALFVLEDLDPRSKSLPESETRAVLTWAGLPRPEVNPVVHLDESVSVELDLLYREQRMAVEYEGSQHQLDREQYASDIDRYALFRERNIAYVQVTKEKLRSPRRLVAEVHRALVTRGYAGSPPDFGERWAMLFERVSSAVGSRKDRILAAYREGVVS